MRFVLLIALFTLSLSSFAQKGKIDGKITDARTGSPLAGITVLIKETGKGIATDLDGRFVLNAEPGKKYTLVISSTSYEGKELSDEMADVLWVLICLANQTGVDLTTALQKNFEKKNARDATRHRDNEKLK